MNKAAEYGQAVPEHTFFFFTIRHAIKIIFTRKSSGSHQAKKKKRRRRHAIHFKHWFEYGYVALLAHHVSSTAA
jgi:hypothetical protein